MLSVLETSGIADHGCRFVPHISTGLHEAIATAMFLSLASRTTWLDTHGTVGTSEPGRPTGLRRLEWRFLFINWCFPRSSRLKYQRGGKEASANTQHRCTTKKTSKAGPGSLRLTQDPTARVTPSSDARENPQKNKRAAEQIKKQSIDLCSQSFSASRRTGVTETVPYSDSNSGE